MVNIECLADQFEGRFDELQELNNILSLSLFEPDPDRRVMFQERFFELYGDRFNGAFVNSDGDVLVRYNSGNEPRIIYAFDAPTGFRETLETPNKLPSFRQGA